jgi:hypothetical protein
MPMLGSVIGVILGFEVLILSITMDANELVIVRSLMIVFSHIFLLGAKVMNIPLATFWLEDFINQELEKYPRMVMIFIFVAAQSVAIPYFYIAAVWQGTEQLASAIIGTCN